MNIIPPSPCRDASMRHAIKRIDTSQKNKYESYKKMRRVNVCLFLWSLHTLTRLYNILNFKIKNRLTPVY